LPFPVLQMHQVHDVHVAVIDNPDITSEQLDGYDAMITNLRGLAIGVRTADCIPILLYDPVNKAAAVVHSGWRGTVAKILRNVIGKMSSTYGTQPAELLAVIGPGICADCFQVGEEVALNFKEVGFDINSIWSFRGPKNGTDMSGGHHIDLKEACRQTLTECGVKKENIQISDLCTYEDNHLLYSARKETIECGRNINCIKIL
ncbi:MAG: peptidoglycan editing factor PgeF, partial [Lachnospiraceae bacterium]|nr:peptidoglycan editing factor PgeF [Lachnospiraceae bacterium]